MSFDGYKLKWQAVGVNEDYMRPNKLGRTRDKSKSL